MVKESTKIGSQITEVTSMVKKTEDVYFAEASFAKGAHSTEHAEDYYTSKDQVNER